MSLKKPFLNSSLGAAADALGGLGGLSGKYTSTITKTTAQKINSVWKKKYIISLFKILNSEKKKKGKIN